MRPGWSFVMVGPVVKISEDELPKRPNIHYLGAKTYDQLPAYLSGWDVALMPFVINELTLNSNPLKVREYLAAGVPVVSSDLPEVRRVGLCRIALSAADYPRLVEEWLKDGPGPDRVRAERIFHESWDAKVEEIRGYAGEAMLKKGRPL